MTIFFKETLGLKKVSIVLHRNLVKDEKTVDHKEYIITEADKLFCHYGIKSVTMDDIAKHLGMSKKTIYQHFIDKNDLIMHLMKNKMESQACMIDKGTQSTKNAVQEMFFVVTNMQQMLSNINPMMFYDLQKYHPLAWVFFKEFKEKHLYQKIKDNLQRGIAEGFYRPEMNLDIITTLRLNHIDFVFNQSPGINQKFTVVQAMTEITEHYLYGLCTLEGHKLINEYKQITE